MYENSVSVKNVEMHNELNLSRQKIKKEQIREQGDLLLQYGEIYVN